MKEGNQEHDASEREADSFELQLHQKLGSKHAKVGWGFVLVGFIFAMAPFSPLLTVAYLRPAMLGSMHVNAGVSSLRKVANSFGDAVMVGILFALVGLCVVLWIRSHKAGLDP